MKKRIIIMIAVMLTVLSFPLPAGAAVIKKELPVQKGFTKPVPGEFFSPSARQGRVERITYGSKDYAGNGKKITKTACVYLPYGYDESDAATRYNVMYIMHGWSGTADELFGYGGGAAANMLDNMIARGIIRPLIVVAPTFDAENKPQDFERAVSEVREFHRDFLNDLMPAVEGRYHTYAKGTSKEELASSRDHRAFGGFSLGSVTTWMQLCYNYDYIRYYLPMSSACWYFGGYGNTDPQKTCDFLEDLVTRNRLNERGYFIYACTGTNDTLRGEVDRQMDEMFSRSSFFTPEHVVYYMKDGGIHDLNAGLEYIYNALPAFFSGAGEPNTRVIWR